jgi:hypothetical protein
MANETKGLPDDPRTAFETFIMQLEREYQPWYDRASNRNKILLVIGQGTAVLAGAATALIAGIVRQDQFLDLKWLLVLLPLLGAFATALLAQTRVRDILALRESGRQELQALISMARADYAEAVGAGNRETLTGLHKRLVDDVGKIEKQQASNVLSIIPIIGTKGSDKRQREKEESPPGPPQT